ncbi:MAG: RecQ family ATP-dependent DNA helicase, partial [Planctomycetota bacterium]
MTDHKLDRSLLQRFGIDRLRPAQARVIDQLLAGHRTLAVLPTGGGKSLCYQWTSQRLDGITIVVSPLIALMKDQCDALRSRGIAAARLDGTVSHDQWADQWRSIHSGETKLLYVSPERFFNERFDQVLNALPIAMLAIDEAHCMSQWGHAFRPDYRRLPSVIERWNIPLTLALTATASKQTVRDLRQLLHIEARHVVAAPLRRPNLTLRRTIVGNARRDDCLLNYLHRHDRGATIVYVTRRSTAEQVAAMLSDNGLPADAYHAGLDSQQRDQLANKFRQSKTGIVVATIAFGMGIDKPDIRHVIHYNLPSSVESYSQEIGRAGRDGKPAMANVLLVPQDRVAIDNLAYGDLPSVSAIQKALDRLVGQADHFVISLGKLAWECDLRTHVLASMLVELELRDQIRSRPSRYDVYRVRPRLSFPAIMRKLKSVDDHRQTMMLVLEHLTKSKRDYRINLVQASRSTGRSRAELITALEQLAMQGWIELTPGDLMHVLEWIKRPDSTRRLARTLQARFGKQVEASSRRVDDVLSLLSGDMCLSKALSRHFGGRSGRDCGRCSVCNGEHASDLDTSLPSGIGSSAGQTLLSAKREYPDVLREPLDQARFLCG